MSSLVVTIAWAKVGPLIACEAHWPPNMTGQDTYDPLVFSHHYAPAF